MMENVYSIEDDKFKIIASELESRSWKKHEKNSDDHPGLIWTNLAKVNFHSVRDNNSIVNHLRGSQNLSNKALLAYHVSTSRSETREVSMPLQWSAAYDDLASLIGTVTLNSLYCLTKNLYTTLILENLDKEQDGNCNLLNTKQFKEQIEIYFYIYSALQMESEWKTSPNAKVIKTFIEILKLFGSMNIIDIADRMNSIICDFESLNRYVKWGGVDDVWIVKPVGLSYGEQIVCTKGLQGVLLAAKNLYICLSCGEQIVCTKGLNGVLLAAKNLHYKCVVQKYIERPLTVRFNRKFDIRQWILVTSIDPLLIYGFSECYLRLSSQPYSLIDDDLKNPTVHLCNHAIQKQNPTSDRQDAMPLNPSPIYCDTMMTQNQFEIELQQKMKKNGLEKVLPNQTSKIEKIEKNVFDLKILPKIKDIAVDVILSVRDKIDRQGKGFEWLGLDLMITENEEENSFEVLLLEVNVSPDISLSTPITERLVQPAVKDLFKLLLDEGAADDPLAATAMKNPRNSTYNDNDNENNDGINNDNGSNGNDCDDNNNAVRTKNGSTESIHTEDIVIDVSNCLASDECLAPDLKQDDLKWNLWHVGNVRGKREALAFTRAKKDIACLGANNDYAPRKVSVAERCFEILKHSNLNLDLQSDKTANEGVVLSEVDIQETEEDEDEDEI